MLSVFRGHSVRYLTDEVAKAREGYYTGAVAAGEPPGLWWGNGAETLGLSGEVDADLMEAVYTHLRDPRDPLAHNAATRESAAALSSGHRKYKTADQIYALTAAKMERARIQIGYSRACIEIDGYLAGHGVLGLPEAQETGARSLNSVMVAVMGVSVKHRDRLQRIFLEPAGVERMQREFAHYYELSEDRVALATQVANVEAAVKATEQALTALRTMEAGA